MFDFIAGEVAKFVSAHPENGDVPVKRKELGFTLSYPVDDAAASLGNVIKWNSFSADDTVKYNHSHLSGISRVYRLRAILNYFYGTTIVYDDHSD